MELTTNGRCPKCRTALEEVRGDYHCPHCTFQKFLTHKRRGGLKLGHNISTTLPDSPQMQDMSLEKFELDDLNIRYKVE